MSEADSAKIVDPQIAVRGRVPNQLDKTCSTENLTKAQKRQKTTFELDGQPLASFLRVNNNDLTKELRLSGPPCKLITATIENDMIFKTVYITINKNGGTSLPFAEILKHVPLGSKVKVTFYNNNGFKVLKRVRLNRSNMGLTPDPAKLKRNITPLYQAIAKDLKAGKPLVINTHVVLWDWQFTGAGRGTDWAIGDKPDTNLYWGARYGVYNMLKKNKNWALVKDDKNQAVFKRSFSPAKAWQQLGVTQPFDVYTVLDLHYASEITSGYTAFANDLFSHSISNVTLDDGATIAAGAKSQVMGLIGHIHLPEGREVIQKAKQQLATPKGVFMTACLSAPSFADDLAEENIFGLLFNTQFIAPEGYTFLPFFEAIAQGKPGKQLVSAARSGYQKYHQNVRLPGRFFVNSSTSLDKFMFQYDGDADQDGINNRIDPDVTQKNDYKINKNSITIYPYNDRRLVIKNR